MALSMKNAYEATGVDFVGKGVVEQYSKWTSKSSNRIKQLLTDAVAEGCKLLRCVLPFSFPNQLPEFLFCHRVRVVSFLL